MKAVLKQRICLSTLLCAILGALISFLLDLTRHRVALAFPPHSLPSDNNFHVILGTTSDLLVISALCLAFITRVRSGTSRSWLIWLGILAYVYAFLRLYWLFVRF